MAIQQTALKVDPFFCASAKRPDQDVFLSLHGQQIAKRGRPGTLYARQWIALEPRVVVHDGPGLPYFDVWINSVAVH